MKKKLLTSAILVLSAVLLVAASVLGTFAFLASSTAVSNTFTVGDVAIEMRESAVDADGKDIDNEGSAENLRTSDGNSYELIPGKTYCKDPAIYVKEGSTPSYLFVKVRNGISTIEKDNEDNPTMKEQMVANGWQTIKSNSYGDELFIYVGKGNAQFDPKDAKDVVPAIIGTTKAEEVYEIFNKFSVKELESLTDYAGAKVTLTGFAVQEDTFEGYSEKEGLYGYQRAWNAIVGRFPYESGTVFVGNPTNSGEGTENQ